MAGSGDKTDDFAKAKGLVSIGVAAEVLGVSIDTVRRWDKSGMLRSSRPDGKNRYFSVEELERVKLNKPLTISEAASLLKISPSTLRRLEAKSLIKPVRNSYGERLYSRQNLEEFLLSEYFMRQKAVEEQILEPLKAKTPLSGLEKVAGEPKQPGLGLVTRNLATENQRGIHKVRRRMAVGMAALAFVFLPFIAIIAVLTAGFLINPDGMARQLRLHGTIVNSGEPVLGLQNLPGNGPKYENEPSWRDNVLPFARVALLFVSIIDHDKYLATVEYLPFPDVNALFKPSEDGNVQPLYVFELPSNQLQLTDNGLVSNLNSEFVQGFQPGKLPGSLAVLPVSGGVDGEISDGTITTVDIATGAITKEKLAPGLIINNNVSNTTVSGGGDIEEVVAGIGLTGGGASGSVTLNLASANAGIIANADNISLTLQASGDALSSTTSSGSGLEILGGGLGLLQGCAAGEILKWNEASDVWACSADSTGAASLIVQESDGSPSVNPTTTLQFAASSFTVTDSGGGTALVGLGAGVLTTSNYSVTLDPVYVNTSEAPAAGDITGSFSGGLNVGPNSVALGTDTTGNYVLSIADAGNGTISVVNGVAEGGAVTLDVVDLNCTNCIGSTEIADLTLGTDTAGNYVATVTGGGGLTGSGASEGSTPTLAVGQGDGITVNADDIAIRLDTTAADGATTSSVSGLELVGGELSLLRGCAAGQLLKWDNVNFEWDCAADIDTDTNNFEVSDGDKGDITVSGSGLTWNVDADSVALGTDTTGNFVASFTAGNGLTGNATGEGSTPTLAVVSANGGIVANPDEITLTVQASLNGASSTTSSGSGLEILAGGLSLLQGCTDTQILKWNETTDLWACSADIDTDTNNFEVSDGDKGDITVSGGGLSWNIDADSVALGTDTTGNFVASFTAGTGLSGDATGEGSTPTLSVNTTSGITASGDNIVLDVTYNPTWTADHTWNLAGAEDLTISHDGTGGTVDGVNVTVTPSSTAGTLNSLVLSQAASGNTNGLDAALRINNLDNDVLVGAAIQIANTGGGNYTTIFDILGTLLDASEVTVLNAGIDESEVTGEIESVTAGTGVSGGGAAGSVTLDVGGGLGLTANADDLDIDLLSASDGTGGTASFSGLEFQGGSSDELTLLQGCGDGQLLKWDDTTDVRWECANDTDTNNFEVSDGDKGDITVSGSGLTWNVDADSIALTTDTTGNYVQSTNTSVLTGLSGGSAGSEGANLTLGLDYSQALSGNVDLAANAAVFGQSGLVFEGSTGGVGSNNELFISVTDPTADRTVTFRDASGTVILSGDTFTGGDVTGTLDSDGTTVLTIAGDSVALTTDTTGNYTATIADAGNGTIAVVNGVAEGGAVTLDAIDLNCTNCIGATEINDLTLGTDTAGNYVASANTSVLTGLSGGSAGSEGAALTLGLDYSQALSGNVDLAANAAVFGQSGLVFEGSTGGVGSNNELFISVTDPTADRTVTFRDASGTVILSGDTFTGGDVTGTLDSDGTTVLTIGGDSVALGTDTTGNYVSSATASGGLALTGTEGASLGIDLSSADGTGATGSGSGLELDANGVGLLQGCAQGEILKWDNDTDVQWECAADGGGVADGDKGDISVTGSGATWTIDPDSVALGTDTTGNYVLSIADAGNGTIAVVNGVAEGGAVTLDAIDLNCTNCIGATEITDLTLGTDTAGNYVQSTNTSVLTGLSGGSAGSEGANLTLGLDYSQALSGNVDLAANAAVFGQSGLVFEGSTGGVGSNNELFISVTDPTADRTVTFRDASGTVILSGDTFTGGDVTGTLDSDGTTVLTIAGDSVALTTDTTGNYTATIADAGNGTIAVVNGVAEGGAVTLDAIDLNCTNCIGATEINDLTLGTDTAGNYVSSATASGGLTLTGTEGASLGIDLSSGDGAGATSSGSGLEIDANGVGLLQGCGANELLKWNDGASTWGCATDTDTNNFEVSDGDKGDITVSGSGLTWNIDADSVALTTDTTGNYVQSANTSTLTGLSGGSAGSEGATLTLGLDYTTALSGNVDLAANAAIFGQSGLIFEGSTGGVGSNNELFISITDPTADRTVTFRDASGTVILSGDTFTGGDVTGTLDSDGSTVLTIAGDSVALGTDTTGNYVLSIADAGNGTIAVVNGVAEGGAVTLDAIDLNCTNCIGATEITDLTLGTDTAGNYVQSTNTSVLTGLSGGSAGSEGANLTLGLDYSQALSGNVDLAANAAVFGQSGLVFEGSTGGVGSNNELFISVTDPTADRTVTFRDASGTVILSGDTFTGGDVTGTLDSDGTTVLTIAGDSVALTTDTTGNYTATIADAGNGTIAVVNGVAEGGAVTLDAIDLNCTNCIGATEINDLTLGTDTAGNYVASANTSVLTGLSGGSAGSEGAALTLGLDYSQALSGNVDLAANAAVFGQSGLVFEGSTGGVGSNNELFISVTDPTADRTVTFRDASGTVILSGDTFTGGDVTGTLDSDGSTVLTIAGDAVGSAEITDGTITGDDINANLAGAGLVLTAGSPDVLDVNLNGTTLEIVSDGVRVNEDATFTWLGDHTWNLDGAEDLTVTHDLAGTINVLNITGTPNASANTAYGLYIDQADSANANGFDAGIVIDNSDTAGAAIADGILFVNAGSGFTRGITFAGATTDVTTTGTEELLIAPGSTGVLSLSTANTTAAALNIDATAGGIDIDAANSTITISNASNGAGDDLIFEVTGANDASVVINSSGTNAADAIDLNATAGGITLDVLTSLSFDVTSATAASNISVAANADAEDLTISVTGSAGDLILSSADQITLDAVLLSLDATTSSNLAVTGSGQNLTLAAAGGGAQELILSSAGTGTAALNIDATAGGIDIDAANSTITISNASNGAGDDLILEVTGANDASVVINSSGTNAADAIDLNATAGGITIDVLSSLSFDVTGATAASNISVVANADAEDLTLAVTGSAGDLILSSVDQLTLDGVLLSLDATTASNFTVTGSGQGLTMSAAGGGAQVLAISSAGTGANALDLDATAGGITLDVVTGFSLDVTGSTGASNISVVADADAEDLTIETTGTAGDLIFNSADQIILNGASAASLILSDFITDANAVLYTTTAGVLTRVAETEAGNQCLLSTAGASGIPVWGACSAGTTNDFDQVYAQSITNTNLNMEIDNATGLTFDLTTTGDFAVRDGTTAFATFGNTGGITFADSGTPTADFISVIADGATTTADANALEIDFTTGDGSDVTNSALQIDLASGGTAAGDIVNGIEINMDAADSSTQQGLVIGSNFDNAIVINSGNLITSNLGIEFTESDTNPSCSANDYKIYADTSEAQFKKCVNGVVFDLASPHVNSFTDTTTETVVDADTTNYWDGTAPNITPSSTGAEILVMVTAFMTGGSGNDNMIATRVLRHTSAITCQTTGTAVGGLNGMFATDASPAAGTNMTAVFVDAPATASNIQYTLCSDADTAFTTAVAGTMARIEFTLFEVNDAADLAEVYPTNDNSLNVGEVVTMDPELTSGVIRSSKPYDQKLIGVVSTKPALAIGGTNGEASNGKPIALSGRVPVKISTENGPIKKGDMLTSSSTPGMAMKATKAGATIGVAMQDYDGPSGGAAMMFVLRSNFNGSSLVDIVNREDGQSDRDYSLSVLNHFMYQGGQKVALADFSDVVADRVVAGLEIVTPRVTTDVVALNSIESATAEDIQINNDVAINGTLTADKIRANQIEGLEIFTDRISSLEEHLASGGSTTVLGESTDIGSTVSTGAGVMSINAASVALDLSVGGLITANGGLTVNGLAQFNGESIFDQLVTFSGESLFEGRATFNNDSGGFASIATGQQEVEVTFDNPYAQMPVVTVNVKNGQFVQYAYKNLTKNGFTIVLKDPAEASVEFAWTALSVKDAKTASSP